MSSDGELVLTLWTDDPDLALLAEAAGVDRIGPDLERQGKQSRQAGLGTWISPHTLASLGPISAALTSAAPFARLDPLGPGSQDQIEQVLGLGARVLMLPMFESADDVAAALALVAGRAELVPLLETEAALADAERLLALSGIDEVHIGINDLALALGLGNRFAVLLDPRVEDFCECARAAGVRLGVGGLARPDDSGLPLDPDLVIALVVGLGGGGALLARTFFDGDREAPQLAADIDRLRGRVAHWRNASPEELGRARDQAARRIDALAGW